MNIPDDCICFHLRKAARAVSRTYDDALADVGLSNTRYSLMGILHERGSLGVTELAEVAVMERTTLTRTLALMERDDLVTIEPGDDRRTRVVELSEHGRAKLAEALPVWRRAQKQMIAELGNHRKERLIKDLDRAASTTG